MMEITAAQHERRNLRSRVDKLCEIQIEIYLHAYGSGHSFEMYATSVLGLPILLDVEPARRSCLRKAVRRCEDTRPKEVRAPLESITVSSPSFRPGGVHASPSTHNDTHISSKIYARTHVRTPLLGCKAYSFCALRQNCSNIEYDVFNVGQVPPDPVLETSLCLCSSGSFGFRPIFFCRGLNMSLGDSVSLLVMCARKPKSLPPTSRKHVLNVLTNFQCCGERHCLRRLPQVGWYLK